MEVSSNGPKLKSKTRILLSGSLQLTWEKTVCKFPVITGENLIYTLQRKTCFLSIQIAGVTGHMLSSHTNVFCHYSQKSKHQERCCTGPIACAWFRECARVCCVCVCVRVRALTLFCLPQNRRIWSEQYMWIGSFPGTLFFVHFPCPFFCFWDLYEGRTCNSELHWPGACLWSAAQPRGLPSHSDCSSKQGNGRGRYANCLLLP